MAANKRGAQEGPAGAAATQTDPTSLWPRYPPPTHLAQGMSFVPRESTVTAREQQRVEQLVGEAYAKSALHAAQLPEPPTSAASRGAPTRGGAAAGGAGLFAFADKISLDRAKHVRYCRAGLESLSAGMSALDASRPWLCYWIVHSLELMGEAIDASTTARLVDFLGTRCQDETGGFAGGPGQMAHLAPTYAAVNALVTLGTTDAYRCIRRPDLYAFLSRLKNADGSFSVHTGGESDVRGTYTAVSVATLTGIADEQLFAGTAEWVARCQTYEGGIGGEPGHEAHGGYTFCGVAALALLRRTELLHRGRLLRWLAGRQLQFEGGFQGRTHKLVDACYSFWQAAVPSMVPAAEGASEVQHYDRQRLQQWLLCCCQDPRGGLRDKPDRPRDYYHTCYSLSGLSLAQHGWNPDAVGPVPFEVGPGNLLVELDPRYNVSSAKARKAERFFAADSSHAANK